MKEYLGLIMSLMFLLYSLIMVGMKARKRNQISKIRREQQMRLPDKEKREPIEL